MSAQRVIALVGRRDEPTDGVADYCDWLRGSLQACGYQLDVVRVDWNGVGWQAALADLNEKAKHWRGCWFLLQYTVLAWSRRGFPRRVVSVVSALKKNGVQCGVVFHDFSPFPGNRLIDRVRRAYQLRILRRLYQLADLAVFTAPLDKIAWLPLQREKATFIPVGANCPEPSIFPSHLAEPLTVAVYGVTGGSRMAQEVSEIGYALKRAAGASGSLQLIVFGRGSEEAAPALQSEFSGTKIGLEILGLLRPEDVSHTMTRADVLLFIRGGISTRRGSAIAGVACGLPIVGFESLDLAWPLTEAGLQLAPEGDREALSAALTKVLADADLRQSLRERSRDAQQQYFCWSAIAQRFAGVLQKSNASNDGES